METSENASIWASGITGRLKEREVSLLCIALLSLAGGLLIIFNTRWGLGISPDSVTYLQAARNLASGSGLTLWREGNYVAMTHFPPLYSIVLAAAQISRMDILAGARWLQALLYSANIATIGIIVWLSAPAAHWLGALAAGLTLISLPMLQIHSWIWSEPLFILLGMWGLFILYRYLDTPSWARLLGAAVLIGLAWLARYIGISHLLAGCCSLLLLSHKKLRFRLLDCLVFILISSLPILLWLARNSLTASNTTNRVLAFHPISFGKIKSFVSVTTSWLMPQLQSNLGRLGLAIVAALVMTGAMAFLWRSHGSRKRMRPLAFIFLFIVSYITTLILSISFLDSSMIITRLNNLSPTSRLYSNTPDPIYLHTGLQASWLPNLYNPSSLIENPSYREEMQNMGNLLREDDALLVIFNSINRHPYLPAEQEILKEFPLTPIHVENDGTIYSWKDGS